MTDTPNQPREYDAVLGGTAPALTGALVLGGIEGVKRRLASRAVEERIAALKDALKYGATGLDLVIQALQDKSDAVQRTAFALLRERKEPKVKQALQKFEFYRFFECLRAVKAGSNIAISHGGEAIAYLRGKTIRVENLHSGELLYSIPKYPRAQESFALSADGEILVRSLNGVRKLVEVWYQGELQHSLYGHEDRISAIALSPDGETLATGSQDKTIKLWNVETGKLICTFGNYLTWGAHTEGIWSLTFSRDGEILASSSHDGTIKVWNLRTRDRPRTLKGYSTHLAIAPDGEAIASTTWDRKILLWNASTGELTRCLEGELGCITCLAFSPTHPILASGSSDSSIHLWNLETGEIIAALQKHENAVNSLAFSWHGESLISGSEDNTVKMWGVA